ncbi:hypothetical protein [Dactylosporangium sp. NPDC050588]|uniref:hypothetical protein n=1 Tax=Dactylosporangium sp. NPDC050588 TaxID=3157211 RepID=UPI0033E49C2D
MAAEFAEAIGRPPTVTEVMEILELASIGEVDVLRLRFTANIKAAAGVSRVGDLNDAAFAAAAGGLEAVIGSDLDPESPGFTGEVGRRLTSALRESGIEYADVAPETEVRAKVSVARRLKRTRLGDVVAAPIPAGGYRIGVIVAKNALGLAIGFFETVVPVPRVPASTDKVVPFPMYKLDDSIESGRWPIIGHDERLLDRFPRDPEIYHRPDWPAKPRRGEFGAAENGARVLRKIDVEEARAVGLLDGTYRQFLPSQRMLRWLDDRYPPGGRGDQSPAP